VFSDTQARNDLEAILHPLIREETRRLVAAVSGAYVIVVIPLLLETSGHPGFVQRVLVVDCDPDVQVERVAARSGLSRQEVLAIMATQISREERLRRADDVIRNDGVLAGLRAQVENLHRKYLQLAAAA
jgi:dephospho-CoA kinase